MSQYATPTMKVVHKESKDEMVVNTEDFNPEIHEKVRPKLKAALKDAEKDEKGKGKDKE